MNLFFVLALKSMFSILNPELEKTYEDNQRVLEEKAIQLVTLEETVRTILQAISQKAAVYSTCL